MGSFCLPTPCNLELNLITNEKLACLEQTNSKMQTHDLQVQLTRMGTCNLKKLLQLASCSSDVKILLYVPETLLQYTDRGLTATD